MPEIALTKGLVTVVDESDYPALSAHRWHALVRGNTAYAARRGPGRTMILMHRQLTGAAQGQVVDHADRDGLNNTRANLRLCTQAENNANKRTAGGSSTFKGVCWDRSRRQWLASIKHQGRTFFLGRYDDESLAAAAYDAAATAHFGEFALPNDRGAELEMWARAQLRERGL